MLFGVAGYHIEVDSFVEPEPARNEYWHRYHQGHTERKMDDLGIKSGTRLPAWDESILPCGTHYYGAQE